MGWAEPQHQRPVCTVSNLVARLREHRSPGLQEEDLTTLCNIAVGKEVDNDGVLGCKERMAAQGAIEGIVHVLWAQILCVAVQEKGFMALLHLTLGDCSCTNEDNVEARKLHMIEAAALETITSGMLLHGNSAAVQLLGLAALGSITMVNGSDDEMAYAMRRLEAAGAIEATVAALQAHAQSFEMHERGFASCATCRAVTMTSSRTNCRGWSKRASSRRLSAVCVPMRRVPRCRRTDLSCCATSQEGSDLTQTSARG